MYSCLVMAPPDGLEPPTLKVETSCSDPTELRGQSLKNLYFISDTYHIIIFNIILFKSL